MENEQKKEEEKPTKTDSRRFLTSPIILGDLTLASPTTATTIGANGAASALTANPVGYLTIMIGTTAVQIPYYNLA